VPVEERRVADPSEFRAVLGHFPTGVVAVTALGPDDRPTGMTVGSFTSVSLDPLLVAFFPARASSTFPQIRAAAGFCINLLGHDQEWIYRQFAARGADKFREVAWRPAPTGAPIVEGALAWIDCTPVDIVETGDHYLVLGAVRALAAGGTGDPLVFFKGRFERLPSQRAS
jgi:flavin reductase (DIM6/NTAB) family NADH-FMN oxidoreductase RutF